MNHRTRYLKRKAESMRTNGQVPVNVPLLGQQQARQVSPGQIAYPGPTATPIVWPVPLNGPNGQPVMVSFGGFSRLEEAALRIGAGLAAMGGHDIATESVRIAGEILEECAKVKQADRERAAAEAVAQEQAGTEAQE